MKVRIGEVNYIEYLFAISAMFPESVNFFSNLAFKNGYVFCAFDETEPVGIMTLINEGIFINVIYIYVLKKYRKNKIAQMLLNHGVNFAKMNSRKISMRFLSEYKYSFVCEKLCLNSGLSQVYQLDFYRCFLYKDVIDMWRSFCLTRGNRIIDVLLRKGYCCKSFNDTPQPMIKNLHKNIGIEFPGELNPNNIRVGFDKNISHICFKDSTPCSFSTIITNGTNVNFKQLSCRYDSIGTGAFFMPLYMSIEACINKRAELICFAVNKENNQMHQMTNGFLEHFISDRLTQNIYYTTL